MVKVISTEPHPTVVKQVVCKNCGATLEYVPRDVQSFTSSDYTGGIDVTMFIKCPPCGQNVTVKG
jgi:DNA-directed RNA polymerase subunit RPC12/RpoP